MPLALELGLHLFKKKELGLHLEGLMVVSSRLVLTLGPDKLF
jgi:hypothetical protein